MNLLDRHCTHGAAALDPATIPARLAQAPGWRAVDGAIARDYAFPDYRATIAFVNAVAGMAEAENHHPDMTVSHSRCTLNWSTHSVGGLSINDFICAARVDALAT